MNITDTGNAGPNFTYPFSQRRLLFVITEDWFFVSHFLERASAAIGQGFSVAVATRVRDHGDRIASAGIALYPVAFSRRGMNPLVELRTALAIRRIVKAFRPSIVHNVALKPIVAGSIGARLAGHQRIVNAPVGMGYVFTSRDTKASLLRPLLKQAVGALMRSPFSTVIVENKDDQVALIRERMAREGATVLIRGAGVDIEQYRPTAEPSGPPVVCMVARMLRDKGVYEFVAAAAAVKKIMPSVRFQLIGAPDVGNPSSIGAAQLEDWSRTGVIDWLGHRSDVVRLMQQSHIVVLPSYREGLPKSLLEALAAGRPVVATDVEGCREAVTDGLNGLLVPPRNHLALAAAILRLLEDPELRRSMGSAGRRRAEREFASEIIAKQTFDVYARILGP